MRVRYFPLEKGVYEVVPGLRALGANFGQGAFDRKIFQIDESFSTFRLNKIDCLQENPSKYFLTESFSTELHQELALFFTRILPEEYPHLFSVHAGSYGKIHIECHHTLDSICLDQYGNLISFSSKEPRLQGVTISSTLEAFALQVPEDMALCHQQHNRDALCALHVCAPSHWSPAEKIGKSFFEVHAPVPGIEKINQAAAQMVQAMIHKGPYVRFVWSFVTDERLNHHPEPPPHEDAQKWKGRSFSKTQKPPFYLRIERQITFGFPRHQAALFTIRLSFWTADEIKADLDKKMQLKSALMSMTEKSKIYKGVHGHFDDLLAWLE